MYRSYACVPARRAASKYGDLRYHGPKYRVVEAPGSSVWIHLRNPGKSFRRITDPVDAAWRRRTDDSRPYGLIWDWTDIERARPCIVSGRESR